MQSGTYWATDMNGAEIHKYRGFDRGTITRADVLDLWGGEGWAGGIQGLETRFGGMGEALSRDNWSQHCRWVTAPRTLATNLAGKRSHDCFDCEVCLAGDENCLGFLLTSLHPTICERNYAPIASQPCSIEWLQDTDYDERAYDARRTVIDYE